MCVVLDKGLPIVLVSARIDSCCNSNRGVCHALCKNEGWMAGMTEQRSWSGRHMSGSVLHVIEMELVNEVAPRILVPRAAGQERLGKARRLCREARQRRRLQCESSAFPTARPSLPRINARMPPNPCCRVRVSTLALAAQSSLEWVPSPLRQRQECVGVGPAVRVRAPGGQKIRDQPRGAVLVFQRPCFFHRRVHDASARSLCLASLAALPPLGLPPSRLVVSLGRVPGVGL